MRSPFIDPFQPESSQFETEEVFGPQGSLAEEVFGPQRSLAEEETITIGRLTFEQASPALASSPDYVELIPSGNPLLVIGKKDRGAPISANFTAGEFAQAQLGKYAWGYARIDPVLVDTVQRLREFVQRSVRIIDGYYPPKYLKEQLHIKETLLLTADPHVRGRGVRLDIPGSKLKPFEIAMAALAACGPDPQLGVGSDSMTLAVRQQDVPDTGGDPQKSGITSFIKDEKTRITQQLVVSSFKAALFDSGLDKLMNAAAAALVVTIFMKVYPHDGIDAPPEAADWQLHLGDLLSAMYIKNYRDERVLAHFLAYSSFGYLYRFWLHDKSAQAKDTVDSIKVHLWPPGGKVVMPSEANRSEFVKICAFMVRNGNQGDQRVIQLASQRVFDPNGDTLDKFFLDMVGQVISDVYKRNGYSGQPGTAASPDGSAVHRNQVAPANPDKMGADMTGRYQASFPSDQQLLGMDLLVNHAGKYISGKLASMLTSPKPDARLRNLILDFYGIINEQGVATCALPQQRTLYLLVVAPGIRLKIVDNVAQNIVYQFTLSRISTQPFLSARVVDALIKSAGHSENLILSLAWAHPLPNPLRDFFKRFKADDAQLTQALTDYYNIDETQPSVKAAKMRSSVDVLDSVTDNFLPLGSPFREFAAWYTRLFYSQVQHWRPNDDAHYTSKLDLIQKMLSDYRDFSGSAGVDAGYAGLYAYFDVPTTTPPFLYQYKIKMEMTAIGFGPFARSAGTVVIENHTDYQRYPAAVKWPAAVSNKIELPITLYSVGLSLSPGKWRPKIATGQSFEAELETADNYIDTDFAGASVQVTEGKLFEVPIPLTASGGVKATAKTGMSGDVILIEGKGKAVLEFHHTEYPGIPTGAEFTVDEGAEKGISFDKIAEFLPSLNMMTGGIGSGEPSELDTGTLPMSDVFTAYFQLTETGFFRHDDAILTDAGIAAIGKVCADELAALSDPGNTLEIDGYTDASGAPGYNLELSNNRAKNTLQAMKDRLGSHLRINVKPVKGYGEEEANKRFGQLTQRNAWLRKVVILINGRAVLTLE